MSLKKLFIKKNEERRIRAGHPWIFSNEIDTKLTPLKNFIAGELVNVMSHDQTALGTAFINPHSLITGRLFSREKNATLDHTFFIDKIRAALALRERLFPRPFYRLIFGESDALPGLICDRYDRHLVLQINTAGMQAVAPTLIEAFLAVLPNTESILFRNDSPIRTMEQLPIEVTPAFGTPPEKITLEENNCLFIAPLASGQKTGWFYDHRLNRKRLSPYVKGKRVLDVFSYLGAFGIQAACAGAHEVVCIDASPLSKNAITENAALNQLTDKVNTITDDAFVALQKLADNQEKFDVIILDPPAFVKKQKDLQVGLAGYQRINMAALHCLSSNGFLVSCSCSMQVSPSDLLMCARKAGQKTGRWLQLIERGHQAPDHPVHPMIPETDYLKMLVLHAQ